MRKGMIALGAVGLLTAAAVVGAATLGPGNGTASSHREAPLIAEDPSADLTDLYAFRSPDRPSTVTILANVVPGEDPGAGPNWYTFSPNARYNLKVDTDGDARANVTYRFQFRTKTGPFFLGDTAQPFTVTRIAAGR
jgi:type 1 fimbria pilin